MFKRSNRRKSGFQILGLFDQARGKVLNIPLTIAIAKQFGPDNQCGFGIVDFGVRYSDTAELQAIMRIDLTVKQTRVVSKDEGQLNRVASQRFERSVAVERLERFEPLGGSK
jgi:hypothetical protein